MGDTGEIIDFPNRRSADEALRAAIFSHHMRQDAPQDQVEAKMATDREYVDLKIDVSEARNEVRFSELNAKLDQILSASEASRAENAAGRVESRQDYRSMRGTIVVTVLATGLALAALLMSVVTYGDAIFSRGMSVRDVVSAAVRDQAEKGATAPSTATPASPAKPIGSDPK